MKLSVFFMICFVCFGYASASMADEFGARFYGEAPPALIDSEAEDMANIETAAGEEAEDPDQEESNQEKKEQEKLDKKTD